MACETGFSLWGRALDVKTGKERFFGLFIAIHLEAPKSERILTSALASRVIPIYVWLRKGFLNSKKTEGG